MSDIWFEQTDKTFRFSSRGHSGESSEGTVRRSLQLQTEQPLLWPQMSFRKPLSLIIFSASLCCSEWLGSIGTMLCPVPPQQLKVSGDTIALLSIEKPENLCNHIHILLFSLYLRFGIPALRRERMCAHVELLSEAPLTCILGQVGGLNFWIMWPEANISTEGGKVHLWFLFAWC